MDETDDVAGWVFGGLLVLTAIVAIGLIGWQTNWWFAAQNESRTTKVIRQSLGYQSNLGSEITSNIANVLSITTQVDEANGAEVGALKAQRFAVVGVVCGDAAQAASGTLDAEQQTFVQTNCEAGAVSPSSSYNSN